MLKLTDILLIFIILERVSSTFTNNNYIITRNVDPSIYNLQTAVMKKNVISVQLCSQLCFVQTDCHNALYHVFNKRCYLFINQPAKSLKLLNKSEYVFIEDQCSTTYSAGSTSYFWLDCGNMGLDVYTDCQAAHDAGIRENGNYMLTAAGDQRPIATYCMFDESKGWTALIKRTPRLGHYNFVRDWKVAQFGGGMLSTEFFLGNEYMYSFTRNNRKLVVMLEDWDGEVRTANYSTFYIDDSAQNYLLHVSGYSGNAGDSLTYSNGYKWTTFDNDNDASSYNCAVRFTGMWWYKACHHSNLLGQYYEGSHTKFGTGTSWKTWREHYYGYKYIYFMVGR